MSSQLLITGKILKEITKQSVCEHLGRNALITRSQDGFIRNKSCQTNPHLPLNKQLKT